MHYNEFKDTTDKIIHLLVASLPEGLLEQAIDECETIYGTDVTSTAINKFLNEYKSLIKRFA